MPGKLLFRKVSLTIGDGKRSADVERADDETAHEGRSTAGGPAVNLNPELAAHTVAAASDAVVPLDSSAR
jgi:hypothetical protein